MLRRFTVDDWPVAEPRTQGIETVQLIEGRQFRFDAASWNQLDSEVALPGGGRLPASKR